MMRGVRVFLSIDFRRVKIPDGIVREVRSKPIRLKPSSIIMIAAKIPRKEAKNGFIPRDSPSIQSNPPRRPNHTILPA
jgi:hypothetical protein